jgi:hypothetical protein
MRYAYSMIALAATAAFSSADIITVSLGDIAQYSASVVRLFVFKCKQHTY